MRAETQAIGTDINAPLPSQATKKFAYIDALRGFAITSVLFHHALRNMEVWAATGRNVTLSPWLHAVGTQGARGVQLFFIVSALTLCLSQARRQSEYRPWLSFYVRRLFRIAPMFYVALIWYTIIPAFRGKTPWPTLAHIVSTATFTNGWNPYWLNAAHTVVPGGWSIAVEMSFYLLFPVLFLKISSFKQAIIAAAVCAIGGSILYNFMASITPMQDDALWQSFCLMWLPNQISVFLLGFAVYFWLKDRSTLASHFTQRDKHPFPPSFLWLCLLMLVALALWIEDTAHAIIAYSIDFAAITIYLATNPSSLLVNRFWCHIGKISFSGYLVHFHVLAVVNRVMQYLDLQHHLSNNGYFFVLAISALASTVAVATATYHLVEEPGQKVGKALIERLRRQQPLIPHETVGKIVPTEING